MIPFIGIKKLERDGRTYLVIRDPHGVDHTVPAPFKPYAFVRGTGSDLRDLDGKPVRKVEFNLPSALGAWARAMANRGVQTYEADIPYVRRVTTDRGWQMAFDAKIASVDIETDDSRGFPVPTRDRILSVAIIKSDGTELWFNDSDECELLRNVVHALKDVAIAIGWNSGDWEKGFDFPFIRIRAEACGINVERELWHLAFVDVMKEYRAQFRPRRSTLDYVAKLEGLGGKVERDKPVHAMTEAELRDYNITDARLVMEIEKKYGFASILLEKMRLSYQPVVTTGTIRVIDTLVLRKAREMGYVLPTTPERGDEERYSGALVLDPIPGLHKNVAVYDINSLYPSIILFERVSPDKERRLFPDIIKELMEKRFEYKRLWKETGEWDYYIKQYAYKILMNSFYGAIGNPGFRLYDRETAEFITGKGREILTKIKRITERFGKVVVYGDSVTPDTQLEVLVEKYNTESVEGNMVSANMSLHPSVSVLERKRLRIEELFKEVTYRIGEKEYYVPEEDVKVLAFDRETASFKYGRVKYVMRHWYKGKIYRVCVTSNMCVDVTEDHSLIFGLNRRACPLPLNKCLEEVKPTELENLYQRGMGSLLGVMSYQVDDEEVTDLEVRVFELLGFFMGDGSRRHKEGKPNWDKYFGISAGKDVDEVLHRLLFPLKEASLIRDIYKRPKGDIVVYSPELTPLMLQVFKNGERRIPDIVWYAPPSLKRAFLRGWFSADGTVIIKNGRPTIRLSIAYDELAKDALFLLLSIGISATMFEESKPTYYKAAEKVYGGKHKMKYVIVRDVEKFMEEVGFILSRKTMKILHSKMPRRKSERAFLQLKKVEVYDYEGYVYDVEIEDYHTFVGNGIVLHNTDSVFIKGIDFERAEAFERLVNRMIRPYSVKLDKYFLAVLFPGREGEKIKKRYAGITVDGDLVIMGLEVVRGDWPEFVKEFEEELVKRILGVALGETTKEEIEAYIEEVGRALYRGELDEKLVISKSLSKSEDEYKVEAPHIKVLRILRRHGIDVSHLGVVEYYWVRNGRGRQPWPAQLPLDGKRIDYDHYWNLALNKVDVLASTIGIDYRRFRAMSNRSLMDFLRKPKH